VIGDVEAAATDEAKAALLRILPGASDAALKTADLEALTGSDRAALQRALKTIPEVQTIGKGQKGDPLRYFRPEKVSAQTSIPKDPNEQNAVTPAWSRAEQVQV
jgi:hypothetical protein